MSQTFASARLCSFTGTETPLKCLKYKCHCFLNTVEPGANMPIHRHPEKDDSFVVLRGRIRVTTYNDDGSTIESIVISQEDGVYGIDIPKNVWHKLEAIESSVIFEFKQGPFVPHEVEGVLTKANLKTS